MENKQVIKSDWWFCFTVFGWKHIHYSENLHRSILTEEYCCFVFKSTIQNLIFLPWEADPEHERKILKDNVAQ